MQTVRHLLIAFCTLMIVGGLALMAAALTIRQDALSSTHAELYERSDVAMAVLRDWLLTALFGSFLWLLLKANKQT
jgi:hypothetical protein